MTGMAAGGEAQKMKYLHDSALLSLEQLQPGDSVLTVPWRSKRTVCAVSFPRAGLVHCITREQPLELEHNPLGATC